MIKTTAQTDTVAALGAEYGRPDRIMVEDTEGQGIIWMRWHKASISSQFPDRNLFVKPDGTRLAWLTAL
jgi:hypothetical protein